MKKSFFREIRSFSVTIIGSIILVSIINTKAFAMANVQQKSMENTLHSGEKLFVDKLSYSFTSPKRGDIIIFLKIVIPASYLIAFVANYI